MTSTSVQVISTPERNPLVNKFTVDAGQRRAASCKFGMPDRRFYLEEVECIRLANAAVFAGRRLHVELEREEEGEWHSLAPACLPEEARRAAALSPAPSISLPIAPPDLQTLEPSRVA